MRRLKTAGEVRKKLLEEKHSPSAAALAVAELQRLRVLDDAAFASVFASHKLRTAHWGRTRLRHALLQRLVPATDADAALSALFDSSDEPGDDDAMQDARDVDVLSPQERHDALLEAARKQWRSMAGQRQGGVSPAARMRRVAGWLARRGHDFRTVDSIVKQLAREDGHDASDVSVEE